HGRAAGDAELGSGILRGGCEHAHGGDALADRARHHDRNGRLRSLRADRPVSANLLFGRYDPVTRPSWVAKVLTMATDRIKLADPAAEAEQAQAIAARYRHEYVDLREASIDHDLFRSIPVDLMFRYNFVPLHAQNGTLEIALSDPRNLNLIDELTLL